MNAVTAASSLSADQLREEAREEWLARRKGESQGRAGGQEKAKGQETGAGLANEKDQPTEQRDKSKGKDDDFGL